MSTNKRNMPYTKFFKNKERRIGHIGKGLNQLINN